MSVGNVSLQDKTNVNVKTRKSWRIKSQSLTAVLLLAPLIIILLVFLAWPVIWTIILSFTNLQLTGPTATNWGWVGFSNFIKLFNSAEFGKSVYLSITYLFGSAYIGQCLFGFILALLFVKRRRWVRATVGGIIVLSWVVPEIIAAFMWYALLSDGGVLQTVLHYVHIPYNTWLISHPMLSVNLANTWRGVAFSMMIFTAAISNIPPDLMEAADVDGASAWWKTIHVTIPMISSAILVDLVLVTLATLNNFTLIYAMTGGGPGNNSQVLSVLMYQKAFSQFLLSYGSAISVVLLAIGGIFSVFYIKALKNQNDN